MNSSRRTRTILVFGSFLILIATGIAIFLYGSSLRALENQPQTLSTLAQKALGEASIKHVANLGATNNLTSFAVDVSGTFAGSDSGLRIVLKVKENGQEKNYLVFNKFNLTGTPTSFTFEGANIETSQLPNVQPIELRWESSDNSQLEIIKRYVNTPPSRSAVPTTVDQNDLKVVGDKGDARVLSAVTAGFLKQSTTEINQSVTTKASQDASQVIWKAGRTSKTDISYQQLSDLFAGDPPLGATGQEFLFYTGGIINIGGVNSYKVSPTSTLPKSFDWRNWHGANFVTSVKDQLNCGSCWAFSSIAALEASTNIRYNEPIDRDLSEQQLVAKLRNHCRGGWQDSAFNLFKTSTVLTEAEDPYIASSQDNRTSINVPAERVRLVGSDALSNPPSAMEIIRHLIQRGPQAIWLYPLKHTMSIVGYDIDENGYITWHVKNSWGRWWGEDGFVRLTLASRSSVITQIIGGVIPFFPQALTKQSACTDRDGDGHYFWGINQTKSEFCPPGISDDEDANDGDSTMYAFDTNSGLNTPLSLPNLQVSQLKVSNTTLGATSIKIALQTNYPDKLNIDYTIERTIRGEGGRRSRMTVYKGSTLASPAEPYSTRRVELPLPSPDTFRGLGTHHLVLKFSSSYLTADYSASFQVIQ